MLVNISILLFTAVFGGFLAFKYRSAEKISFGMVLGFAGSYLLVITLVHILPELYISSSNIGITGIYVVSGFFLQLLLENLTAGAEHGHVHPLDHHHEHKAGLGISLLIGMSIHALLEGSLLTQNETIAGPDNLSIALGIGLHKLPAAFAMVTILLCYYNDKARPIIFLILFSLASPLGLILGQYALDNSLFTHQSTEIIFGLVSGSFLYISTTIVFESAPGHSVKFAKLLALVLGATAAILIEMLL